MANLPNPFRRVRLVFRHSSPLLKCVVLTCIVLAIVALLVIGSAIRKTQAAREADRARAAQMEQENAQMEKINAQKGTIEWIKQIGIYTYWLICIHTVEDNSLPWSMIPELLPNHQLLSFVIVIVMKIVLMAATCMALKRIAKYKYHRKMMRHGK